MTTYKVTSIRPSGEIIYDTKRPFTAADHYVHQLARDGELDSMRSGSTFVVRVENLSDPKPTKAQGWVDLFTATVHHTTTATVEPA